MGLVWELHAPTDRLLVALAVNEFCKSYQYTQLINEPKRIASNSKSFKTDLFLTNEPHKFAFSGVSQIGLSL